MDFFAAIYGKRGQGKSCLLQGLQATSPQRWLIIDPMHEYYARPATADREADIVIRPPLGCDPDLVFELVDKAAGWAFRQGDIIMAVDEVDIVARPGGVIPKKLDYLARYGRHSRKMTAPVGLVMAARRPTNIPPALASQATDLYSFFQWGVRDREYFQALGINKKFWKTLPKHHFVHMTASGLHVHSSRWQKCSENQVEE